MTIKIRSQRIAREAYRRVQEKAENSDQSKRDKYLAFARSFPTLIHSCGLAQASAFALAKGEEKAEVLEDVTRVVMVIDSSWPFQNAWDLHQQAIRQEPDENEPDVSKYLLLTRQALESATWIKRYAEALLKDPSPRTEEVSATPSENRDEDLAPASGET